MTNEPTNNPSPHHAMRATAEDPISRAAYPESVDPDLTTTSPATPVDDREPSGHNPPPIAEQRAELAETVDALTARLDVRERARTEAVARADQLKRQASEHQGLVAGSICALGVAAVLTVIGRRRHQHKKSSRRHDRPGRSTPTGGKS